MAVIDEEGRGWVFDRKLGKAVLFSDRDGRLTTEGVEHCYEQQEAITRCLLEGARCLVTGGTYTGYLQQLFGLYDQIPDLSERSDISGLQRLLQETDSISQKLQRGFVKPEERKVFLKYSAKKKESIISRLYGSK